MKPYHFILFLSAIILSTSPVYSYDKMVKFSSMNMHEARQKASQEGKLIFLDFHAKWCSPCKWMEQTTFTDENVIQILQQDYIAIKVDIDDQEGYDIKKHFDVKYLPTLLIFNSEGIMIERVEKTLTPRALKELLSKHNEPVNKKIIKHSVNSSPSLTMPVQAQNNVPAEMKLTEEEQQVLDQQPVNQHIHKLQVGVFEKYESAETFIQKLNTTFMETVTVKNDFIQGKMVFRVLLGQFESKEEAMTFKKLLKEEHDMDSILQ
jgi:thioredoxin 1